MSLVKI